MPLTIAKLIETQEINLHAHTTTSKVFVFTQLALTRISATELLNNIM